VVKLGMRRLAFICETGTDVRLVEGLARHFRLTLLVRLAFQGKEISWPVAAGTPVSIEVGPPKRLEFAVHALAWLVHHADEFDAVLVQNTGAAALAANLARRRTSLPTLLLVCSPSTAYFRCRWRKHEVQLPRYALGLAALEATRRLNAILTQRYVVLSDYLARSVASDGPARSEKIPLYGVDTSRFRPLPSVQRAGLRRDLGLPEDAFVIFFSSRIAPEKDTETLLEAARILARPDDGLVLLNMSGGHREFLQRAKSVGLEEHVRARDAVHPVYELPRYYQAADVCIQASLEEGLGFSPLEALACEVPVIVSSVGGLKETIRNRETGLTFPAGNASRLAECIRYARDHPEKMRAMAQRGRNMVQEGFEASVCFHRLASLVEALAYQGEDAVRGGLERQ
jgi:glycosyltransferase involved in cell wall biosynthesis